VGGAACSFDCASGVIAAVASADHARASSDENRFGEREPDIVRSFELAVCMRCGRRVTEIDEASSLRRK
jgi:hypothetical protein